MAESKSNDTQKGRRRGNHLNRQLKNTRLCMYLEQGVCKYGAKCQFAHSLTALESAPDLRKTRICPDFEAGTCTNPACPFAHGHEELRSTDFYYKTSMCMWHAVGKCRNGAGCRFAHGEHELRAMDGQEKKVKPASGDAVQKQQARGKKKEKDGKEGKGQQHNATKDVAPQLKTVTAPHNKPMPPPQTCGEPMFIQPFHDMGSLMAAGSPAVPMAPALAHPGVSYDQAPLAAAYDMLMSPAAAQMWPDVNLARVAEASGKPDTSQEISELSANIKYLSDQVKKLQQSIVPPSMGMSESTKSGSYHASSGSSSDRSPPGSLSPPEQQQQQLQQQQQQQKQKNKQKQKHKQQHEYQAQQPQLQQHQNQHQLLQAEVARLNWELQRAAISQALIFGQYSQENQVPVR